ncbi:odorant receptor 4-like [Trichogramma pretiosum]|uniref:odorant receptor 4-like n=1 Tax=Trichogramma pretiosum TaxID=7493 RepID=UPI0006C97730|nr:odorant receptor 4-like [Trichogramma pretiosum]
MSSVSWHSEYAVQMCRYFLRPIGLWVTNENSWREKFFNKLLTVSTFSLLLFLLIPCALHTFLEEPNIAVRMKLIGPMSFAVMAIIKYSSLTRLTKRLEKCFKSVEEDWKSSDSAERKVLHRQAKIGRLLSIFSALLMYSGSFIFYHVIMPVAAVQTFSANLEVAHDSLDINGSSSATNEKKLRILTFPTYEAWVNLDDEIAYQFVYLMQCLSGFVMDTITVGTCSLAAVFVTHTCAQLEIVVEMSRNYVDSRKNDKTPKTSAERLTVLVKKHCRALKFATQIKDYLNGICFVEFIGCTANICFVGYYCLTEWERKEPISMVTYFILVISFTLNIFIFCFIGEHLAEHCKQLDSVYMNIDWYKLPGKEVVDLLMIIAVSRRPVKLMAGSFADLTLITFSSVMKTAFTYFNLLRTII